MADALGAHKRALSFGGRPGIPNPGLIESALARPYSGYYRSIRGKAAALVESMAGNHGFADGNKRTTLILVDLLLNKSGYVLSPLPAENIEDATEEMILGSVQHQLSFDDLVEWFRLRIHKK